MDGIAYSCPACGTQITLPPTRNIGQQFRAHGWWYNPAAGKRYCPAHAKPDWLLEAEGVPDDERRAIAEQREGIADYYADQGEAAS